MVNAYQVSGGLYLNYQMRIAQAVGLKDTFAVNGVAVAAAMARHGTVIVDLSGSMVRDNYVNKNRNAFLEGTSIVRMPPDQEAEPALGRGTEFAFFLASDNPDFEITAKVQRSMERQAINYNYLCTAGQMDNSGPPAAVCDSDLERAVLLPDLVASFSLTPEQQELLHFHDDYVLKKTLGDADWARKQEYQDHHPDPASGPWFEVEVGADKEDGRWYRVNRNQMAQPLGTLITGLQKAVYEFTNRKVAGESFQHCYLQPQAFMAGSREAYR